MEQQHAIGKLLLEVQLPSREEAFALQGTLSTRCTTELEPMLSALLDSWADPDTLLQIDKLEIDLGSCNLETLRKELPEMIISYLRKHYQEMQAQLTMEGGMQRMPLIQGYYESWLYFLERGSLPSAAVKWQQQEWEAGVLAALSSETFALQQCRVLLMEHPYAIRRLVLQFSPAFVQNWILAYSADAYRQVLQLMSEWETFIYQPQLRQVVAAIAPGQQDILPVLPARSSYHEHMLIWLISEVIVPGRTLDNARLLQQLIQQLRDGTKEELTPRLLYVLQKVTTAAVKAPVLLQQAATTLATQYVPEISAIQKRVFAGQEAERHVQGEKRDREDSVQVRQNDPVKDNPEQQREADARSSREQEGREEKSPRDKNGEALKNEKASSGKGKENREEGEKERRAAAERNESVTEKRSDNKDIDASGETRDLSSSAEDAAAVPEPPAEGTVYYINNAGLILLHPYLSFCFDALGLREGQQFKDEAAKHRAVQLLGYLAYGEEEIPEYDLVLPKILCGILPAEPVKRFIPLTNAEKNEANELLAAVISHWNALGNTSPDGLRGNFLLREGKLEWKEEEWQLYVTQQAYDMLLNRLPWGFSVVGLSWMPWLIKTVWT